MTKCSYDGKNKSLNIKWKILVEDSKYNMMPLFSVQMEKENILYKI